MRYRFPLPPEEYPRLVPSFTEFGGVIPDPALSKIAVCESADGEIVGWIVIQFVLHAEPGWVRAGRETRGVYQELQHIVSDFLDNETPMGSPILVVADSAAAARRCRRLGMTEVGRPLFVGFTGASK